MIVIAIPILSIMTEKINVWKAYIKCSHNCIRFIILPTKTSIIQTVLFGIYGSWHTQKLSHTAKMLKLSHS